MLHSSLKQEFDLTIVFGSGEDATRVMDKIGEKYVGGLTCTFASATIAGRTTGAGALDVVKATKRAGETEQPRYYYVDEFFAALLVQRGVRQSKLRRRDGRGFVKIATVRQDGWCSYYHGRNDYLKFTLRHVKSDFLQRLLQPAHAV